MSNAEIDWLDAYVGGALDFGGNLTFSVNEDSRYKVGYNFSIQIQFRSYDGGAIGVIDNWCMDNHIMASVSVDESGKNDRYELSVERRDDVEQFLNEIQSYTFRQFEVIDAALTDVIPAMEEGVHRTPEGFAKLLDLREELLEVHPRQRGYKLTAEQYRNERNL